MGRGRKGRKCGREGIGEVEDGRKWGGRKVLGVGGRRGMMWGEEGKVGGREKWEVNGNEI